LLIAGLYAVAFFEFLLAAARAGVVTADILEAVTHRFLMAVIAVGAVYMPVIMIVGMIMVVVVIAVRAMDMGVLIHGNYSEIYSPGIISPLRDMCTLRPNIRPVFTLPCRR
jgi:hypothetical protein